MILSHSSLHVFSVEWVRLPKPFSNNLLYCRLGSVFYFSVTSLSSNPFKMHNKSLYTIDQLSPLKSFIYDLVSPYTP